MDKIFDSWLSRQHAEGVALAAASDILQLDAEPGVRAPRRFIARFDSPSMVLAGECIRRVQGFAVLFNFPNDYLRSARDAGQIINLMAPRIFHPNVMFPWICVGRIAPGTGLVELVFRVYEILTFQRITVREDDALNRHACAWGRLNLHLFPLTKAPLKRRNAEFVVDEIVRNPDASAGN